MPPGAEPLVSARELGVRFGGLRPLGSLTFTIARGELLGIIGPNGAGKTTLFHVMSGVVAPTQGSLRVDGADLTGRSPQIFCRRGVARTFQTPRVFRASTALENVAFGMRFARGGDSGEQHHQARGQREAEEELHRADHLVQHGLHLVQRGRHVDVGHVGKGAHQGVVEAMLRRCVEGPHEGDRHVRQLAHRVHHEEVGAHGAPVHLAQ